MTPGASEETADGMSEEKIEQIIGLMRQEKYRFSPARRVYIPKKNGQAPPSRHASGGGIVPLLPGSFRVLFLSRIRFIR